MPKKERSDGDKKEAQKLKKKRMQRNKPIFGGALKKLFKSVSEGYSISQNSLAIVEDFTKDIINRICEELGNLSDFKRPKLVDK